MTVPLAPGPASLRERAGVPLAVGTIPAGSAPVVAVAAHPYHPSNGVVLLTRRGRAPAQAVRAAADPAPGDGAVQWFRAALPAVEEGRSLDYRMELVRSGQRLAGLPADGSWLTVTGGPPAGGVSPGPEPAAAVPVPPARDTPGWTYDLRFFAHLTITGGLEIIGDTPDGYRINFLVASGRVVGPGVDAVVHPGGGDWMCIRRDGVAALDIRATYETADGAVTFYRAGGVLDLGPDGHADAAAGRLTGCPPFYATPKFVTAHPEWQWLNRVQGIGIGRVVMEERRVDYDVYIPQVGDRLPDD